MNCSSRTWLLLALLAGACSRPAEQPPASVPGTNTVPANASTDAVQRLSGDIMNLRALLQLCDDPDPRVRLAALKAVQQLNWRAALPAWEKARRDPDPAIQREAFLTVLRSRTDEEAVALLVAALDDPLPGMVAMAEEQLLLRGRLMIPLLQQLAVTASNPARLRMVRLITALRDPELAPSLLWIQRTANDDEAVRQAVQTALAELGPAASAMVALAATPVEQGVGAGTTPQPDCNVTLRLNAAVNSRGLLLDLECRQGRWPVTAWGYAPNFNKGDHEFTVKAATRTDTGTVLELSGAIADDPWVSGGRAAYRVEFHGTNGTWQGQFRGVNATGTVQVLVKPAWPVTQPYRPLRYQEHPRLGGRRTDWQAPTNVAFSAEADAALEKAMQPRNPALNVEWARSAIEMARAYDGLYWRASPAMRRYATDAMLGMARGLLFSPSAQSTPWHNWQGRWRGGAGIAAIAALNDPCTFPLTPPANEPVRELLPDASAISTAAPVSALTARLARWEVAGRTWEGDFDEGGALAIDELVGKERGQVLVFQVTIRVTLPVTVRVQAGLDTTLQMAGKLVQRDGLVRLAAGDYALRAEVRPGTVFDARAWTPPRFTEVDDPQERRAQWRREFAWWQANGGVSPKVERYVTLAEINCRRYIEWAIGDGGFNTEDETYTLCTMAEMQPFLTALAGLRGRNLVAGGHAEWIPLRGRAGSFGDGGGARFYGGQELVALMSPAMRQGLTARTAAEFPGHGIRDRQKTGYVFRNGWQGDAQDIFVVVEGKGQHLRSAHTSFDTGTFRLFGLGSAWAVYSQYGRDVPRDAHNVVTFTDQTINGTLGARELHYDVASDGSGNVSLDMDPVYLGFTGTTRSHVDYEGVPNPAAFRDLGLRGVRAVAADFTGKCGAPGLVVIADKITGPGTRVWQMHLAGGVSAEVAGASFTLRSRRTDATVRGTFVVPADVKLAVDGGRLTATGTSDFVVVLTLQRGAAPVVKAGSATLPVSVAVGAQTIRFDGARITSDR